MYFIFSVLLTDKHFHITIWCNINYSCLSFLSVVLTDKHLHITIWLKINNYSHLSFFVFLAVINALYITIQINAPSFFCLPYWNSLSHYYSTQQYFIFPSLSLKSTFTQLFNSILLHFFLSSSRESTFTLLFNSISFIWFTSFFCLSRS